MSDPASPSSPAPTPASPQEKRSYGATINKPQTPFPMKANLVQNEPASMKRWDAMGLYDQVRQARAGAPHFAFHDGPPYANGSIHLGHLLNKVLKDFVVRSRTMAGLDCPYIPGWDCHGLPIEHKVVQDLGEKARTMEPLQIRRKCQASAEKFVKLQAGQMQRLLTLADYAHPYVTMDPAYEAGTLEVFAALVAKGLVYRALKPVHWSIANRTALAEAELEYEDRQDTSVYVLMELVRGSLALPPGAPVGLPADAPLFLMIWTTTPWTLPANLAVAVHEKYEYGLFPIAFNGRPAGVVIARELAPRVLTLGGAQVSEPLATWSGAQLARARYLHPFIERTSPIVTADYVTLEDGTGLVHTSPGHGVEDYQTGLREKIRFSTDRRSVLTRADPGTGTADRADTYCPVRADGTYDDTSPEWLRAPGIDVWKANPLVVERLAQSGHLFHAHSFTHSYPHDWRSKTPVIFRATEQWFVGVDMPIAAASYAAEKRGQDPFFDAAPKNGACPLFSPKGSLRQRALAAADAVKFYPAWGHNRLRGMLESRPDWCLSRQRAWGIPIPAFFAENGVDYLLTAASIRAVAGVIRQHGSDAWFKAPVADLLSGYDPVADPDSPRWLREAPSVTGALAGLRKSAEIFDVWFESGTSWNAVIWERLGEGWFPSDLYLEGSDQHRGWFQHSLLPSLAITGQPPFRRVLTHGFMVDRHGEKISKSKAEQQKHIPTLEELLSEYGADIARWWVSSVNTDNDIKIDKEYFKFAGEEYRKVRNTLKYLLSNLYDYPAGRSAHTFTEADATSLDAWVLGELNTLIQQVRHAYDEFEFRPLHEALFNFCNETLSAVYLAATKDRMYCDKPDSPRRRRSQAAMHRLADALIRLLAPIMPHTADEAWRALYAGGVQAASVHLALLPDAMTVVADPDWAKVIDLRGRILKVVEKARDGSGVAAAIENPLDLGVRTTLASKTTEFAFVSRFNPADLADLCGVSRVEVVAGPDGAEAIRIEAMDLRQEPRCERCWKHDGTVKPRRDGGMLSDRDADALGLA